LDRPEGDERVWTHVTQPLTSNGAAVNVVIREVSNVAYDAGVRTVVASSDRRDVRFPRADITPVDFSRYLSHDGLLMRERISDLVRGHAGLPRRNVQRMYRAIGDALPQSGGPIIVHDGYQGAAGLVALRRACPDRPLFLWMHNKLSPAYSTREVRRYISLADRVICVSDWLRDSVRAAARSDRVTDRVVTVLNGVDPERFTPRREPRDQETVPSILFVGRMLKLKGPQDLVTALGDLHKQGVDFRATFLGISNPDVGGSSAFEASLRRGANAFSDKVTFAPFRSNDELPGLYREYDILVVPSRFEDPCPLVLLEGMASGLAIVASRRGGIPQVGQDAVRLFDRRTDLAGQIKALIQDAQLRRDLGKRARGRAEQLTWSRTFEGANSVVSLAGR
jgi:glycosyltransferase involved in cell wall biosynthesis